MRGFCCVVLWIFPIFSSTIAPTKREFCYMVPANCQTEQNVPLCIEEKMKNCEKEKGRVFLPKYFSTRISSEETVDTERGYKIHISGEALQRSRNGQGDPNLFVSLLNETFFRVNSSLNTKTQKGNDSSKPDTILHGQTVLGVWLGKNEVQNLSQPVQIRFIDTKQSQNGTCVYWHLQDNGKGNWRTDGCNTTIDNGDFVCSCNHLSFFAVLINPEIPSASHIDALNYISYVGSAISIAFTALMIAIFLCQRRKQCEHSVIIHVQLSGSLLLLHISFLCSVWFSGHTDLSVCQALGLLLHWCLLATFTWTAIEGFHIYLLVVRVFNIYIKRYMLKLSLVGWGVPTITVIICGVTKVYGRYTFYMGEENSTITPLCWISTQIVSYITVNGYLGLVMLFNMVILGVVLVKMHKVRSQTLQIKDHRRRAWKEWVSLLGLSCVLGVPWVLAFSTYGPLSLPALYVFTILNSLQGLLIFLWFLTLTCQTRKVDYSSSKGTIQVSFNSNDEIVTTR
ncbi:adhesion G protein-coupled receptor G3-like [Carassius auratus]|uniref:Adhesion G protein-coupled receptor G3-like n=1 Tax=Carassius auratus TaxID=7957 RepID=A0A6P6PU00_CARAU|nr:adhesion G protein-coupled receptor G3-like [Carassius auratus]XP_026124261.1 adhesion G protein-coupled receptor G3-like [Carassius auratus]XP_026124262.1 adhesion G protein-coupled receptor G3-like [Carassius auratus]